MLRSLETPEGKIINGSCLCVEYILQQTGFEQVATLDCAIASRNLWNVESPLSLQPATLDSRPIFQSARVGLSLKKAYLKDAFGHYLLRPYRYLTEPKGLAKGKLYLILALHLQGKENPEIEQLTGSSQRVIQRYLKAFQEGQDGKLTTYFGKTLSNQDLCQLHGILGENLKMGLMPHPQPNTKSAR